MSLTRYLLATMTLMLVFTAMLDQLHPQDFFTGAALSFGLLLLFRRFLAAGTARFDHLAQRAIFLFPFLLVTSINIIVDTLRVARITLHLGSIHNAGIIRQPFGERTRLGVIISALVTTLAPGSFLIRIDWLEREMIFHYLDASQPETIRQNNENFYQKYQKKVFP